MIARSRNALHLEGKAIKSKTIHQALEQSLESRTCSVANNMYAHWLPGPRETPVAWLARLL